MDVEEAQTQNWQWACDEQDLAFQAGPAPLLLSGGFGSGKTSIAILKLLYLSDLYPGYRSVVARKFYSELKHTTFQTFLKLCPPSAYSSGHKAEGGGLASVQLNNGSRFLFMHLGRPDATSIIRGLEINAMLLDQAEEMHEEVYDMIEARLGRWDKAIVPQHVLDDWKVRSSGQPWPYTNEATGKVSPPSYCLLTANPDIETHWLWRRFHPDSPEWQKGEGNRPAWKDMGYRMLTFDSRKNKFANKENLRILTSKDDSFQARYVRGEWGNPEGAIFNLTPASVLEAEPSLIAQLKSASKKFRILDHGDSGVTCCLWAASDEHGNIVIYRELYIEDSTIRNSRELIRKLSKEDTDKQGNHPRFYDLADPAIFNKVPKKIGGRDVPDRWTVAEEWADTVNYPKEDHVFWTPADNSEDVSRERLGDLLRIDPSRKHIVTGLQGAPRLYFIKKTGDYTNGCDNAITEIRSARKVKVGSMNGRPIFSDERDETVPDHGLDCVRYLATSRPMPLVPKRETPSALTFAGYSKLAKDARKKSGRREGLYK